MSADAFRRLTLIACSMLLAGTLAAVAEFVSVKVALAATLGGLVLAIVLTIEQTPDEPAEELEREGLSRREIARRNPREDAYVE